MALQPGTRLGPYEIVGPLGAGGMGEVYKGRDTRLDRTVAIKVLPAHLSKDPDLKQRFEREAKAISALQHPNICVLHDVGRDGDIDFLVMEHLDGETLNERLKRGPLSLEQFWKTATEITDALDRAHRAGIVHRDLKPGNIMLTKRGAKLLDFGLAKSQSAFASSAPSGTSKSVFEATMSHTSPASPLTSAGSIVGTVQYMSPEQIEGREITPRSDLFSLGLVFYEMLTGVRAFEGKTQASVVASILALDPKPMRELKSDIPSPLETVVRQCLEKDPEARVQSAHDLKLELTLLSQVPKTSSTALLPQSRAKQFAPWILSAMLAVAVLGVWHPWKKPTPKPLLRLSTETGANISFPGSTVGSNLAISPDGTTLVFAGISSKGSGPSMLYVRRLDQLEATPLAGTEGATEPFISPDGQWVGYTSGATLQKILIAGGAPQILAPAPLARGASWGEDDTIVAELVNRSPLSRLSANGGPPQKITTLDTAAGEVTHRWPDILPGGKAVIFTASTNSDDFDDATICLVDLKTLERKTLLRGGSYARYVSSGHIIYMNRGSLYAVPFDLSSRQVTGRPIQVAQGVLTNSGTGGAQYAISRSGTLLYVGGIFTSVTSKLVTATLDGKTTPLTPTSGSFNSTAISPNGNLVAMGLNVAGNSKTTAPNVAIYDPKRDTMTHLTFVPAPTDDPVWSPGGHFLALSSYKDGNYNLYIMNSDGTGEMRRVAASNNPQISGSWHPSGKYLIYFEVDSATRADIYYLPLEGDENSGYKAGAPVAFIKTPAAENWPSFSPDGHWVAYNSDDSGRNEVYVRPFPSGQGRWQVSNNGGAQALWSRTGHQIFYVQDSNLFVADYTLAGSSIQFDKPRQVPHVAIKRDIHRNFDLFPDGKRIAFLQLDADQSGQRDKIVFVENLTEYLEHAAMPGK